VQRGLAEEGAVEHHALEPQLDVALPGEADAPVGLDRVPGDLHGPIAHVGLRDGRHARRLVRNVVEGVGGVPHETPRRLDVEGHVHELVLERLEVADGDAELLAGLGVLDAHVHEPPGGAEGIGGEQDECRVAQPRRRGRPFGQGLARGLAEHDGVEGPHAVDALEAVHVHAAGLALHQGESGAGGADHDQVGVAGVGHVGPGAGELGARRQAPVLGLPAASRLAEGDGAERLTAREARQPASLLLLAAAELQGQAGQRVSEEGARRTPVGQRLLGQGEVEQLEPRAAVLVRDDEPRHPHLDEALPEGRIPPLPAVEELADAGRRALVLDVLPDRLLEQVLLFRDVEVHLPELLSA
jgi:hypothetical protein